MRNLCYFYLFVNPTPTSEDLKNYFTGMQLTKEEDLFLNLCLQHIDHDFSYILPTLKMNFPLWFNSQVLIMADFHGLINFENLINETIDKI